MILLQRRTALCALFVATALFSGHGDAAYSGGGGSGWSGGSSGGGSGWSTSAGDGDSDGDDTTSGGTTTTGGPAPPPPAPAPPPPPEVPCVNPCNGTCQQGLQDGMVLLCHGRRSVHHSPPYTLAEYECEDINNGPDSHNIGQCHGGDDTLLPDECPVYNADTEECYCPLPTPPPPPPGPICVNPCPPGPCQPSNLTVNICHGRKRGDSPCHDPITVPCRATDPDDDDGYHIGECYQGDQSVWPEWCPVYDPDHWRCVCPRPPAPPPPPPREEGCGSVKEWGRGGFGCKDLPIEGSGQLSIDHTEESDIEITQIGRCSNLDDCSVVICATFLTIFESPRALVVGFEEPAACGIRCSADICSNRPIIPYTNCSKYYEPLHNGQVVNGWRASVHHNHPDNGNSTKICRTFSIRELDECPGVAIEKTGDDCFRIEADIFAQVRPPTTPTHDEGGQSWSWDNDINGDDDNGGDRNGWGDRRRHNGGDDDDDDKKCVCKGEDCEKPCSCCDTAAHTSTGGLDIVIEKHGKSSVTIAPVTDLDMETHLIHTYLTNDGNLCTIFATEVNEPYDLLTPRVEMGHKRKHEHKKKDVEWTVEALGECREHSKCDDHSECGSRKHRRECQLWRACTGDSVICNEEKERRKNDRDNNDEDNWDGDDNGDRDGSGDRGDGRDRDDNRNGNDDDSNWGGEQRRLLGRGDGDDGGDGDRDDKGRRKRHPCPDFCDNVTITFCVESHRPRRTLQAVRTQVEIDVCIRMGDLTHPTATVEVVPAVEVVAYVGGGCVVPYMPGTPIVDGSCLCFSACILDYPRHWPGIKLFIDYDWVSIETPVDCDHKTKEIGDGREGDGDKDRDRDDDKKKEDKEDKCKKHKRDTDVLVIYQKKEKEGQHNPVDRLPHGNRKFHDITNGGAGCSHCVNWTNVVTVTDEKCKVVLHYTITATEAHDDDDHHHPGQDDGGWGNDGGDNDDGGYGRRRLLHKGTVTYESAPKKARNLIGSSSGGWSSGRSSTTSHSSSSTTTSTSTTTSSGSGHSSGHSSSGSSGHSSSGSGEGSGHGGGGGSDKEKEKGPGCHLGVFCGHGVSGDIGHPVHPVCNDGEFAEERDCDSHGGDDDDDRSGGGDDDGKGRNDEKGDDNRDGDDNRNGDGDDDGGGERRLLGRDDKHGKKEDDRDDKGDDNNNDDNNSDKGGEEEEDDDTDGGRVCPGGHKRPRRCVRPGRVWTGQLGYAGLALLFLCVVLFICMLATNHGDYGHHAHRWWYGEQHLSSHTNPETHMLLATPVGAGKAALVTDEEEEDDDEEEEESEPVAKGGLMKRSP